MLKLAADRLLDLAIQDTELGPLDLRDWLVILPGSRAGRSLLRQLDQSSQQRGTSLLPPRIETPGQLESLLVRQQQPRISPTEERLSWLLTLQAATAEQKKQLGLDAQTSSGATGLLKLGQLISGTVRQLKQEGSNPGAAAHLMAPRDTEAAKRLLVIEELENSRLELLRRWGVSPGGFSQAAPKNPDQKIILLGILELPSATRDWLSEYCTCEVWVDAIIEDENLYDPWGRPIPELWENTLLPDSIPMLVADQPGDLTLAIVDHVSQQSSIKQIQDVSLGLLDDDLTPWITESLRRHGMGLHPASGIPHSATSGGRLVEGVRNVLATDSAESYLALARHPDVLSRLPIRTGRDDQRKLVLGDLDRWSTQRQPDKAEDTHSPPALLHLREQLEPLKNGEDSLLNRVEQYLQVLANLLGSDDDGIPLVPEGDGEVILETLEKLRECGPCSEVQLSADNFASLLSDLTASSMIPSENDPHAIQGLGWLELAMDDAPHLILTGVSEGKISGSYISDPLLPESLRRELQIPGYEERVARDTHLLRNLVDGRRQTVVAIPARDSQGNPQLPSRLLLRGESGIQRLRDFLDPKKRILLEEELNPTAPELADLGPPTWVDMPSPEKISVTGFARWIVDPVLFQLERDLGCSECHDRDRQLPPMAFGNMVHWVLEEYGKSDQMRDLENREDILAAVNSLLEKYRNRSLALHPRAAVLVQVEQARARLEIWADQQARIRFKGWRIMATEIQLDPAVCKITVDSGSLGVSGRIDRIDFHEKSNRWRILDYKTSDQGPSPEKDHGRKAGKDQDWKKLQLPLYRHFAPTLNLGGKVIPEDAEVGFFNLPGKTSARSIQIAPWTENDYEDAINLAHEIVSEILDPETRALQVLPSPWDRALAGVVIDAEKSLSALVEDSSAEGAE